MLASLSAVQKIIGTMGREIRPLQIFLCTAIILVLFVSRAAICISKKMEYMFWENKCQENDLKRLASKSTKY